MKKNTKQKTNATKTVPKFSSFFLAGFECTYALAENGRRFDLMKASGHDRYCRADYQMIRQAGMKTVREGLAWHEIDKGHGRYDFSRFEPLMQIAREEGVQQIWDLNHFDYPEYLNPFSQKFIDSYAEYAKRCIEIIRKYQTGQIYLSPFNEPSFFAWMCDQGLWAPYRRGKGTQFKKQLVKAAIAAMDAVWEVDSNVRFMHMDPFMHRTPLRATNAGDKKFCDNFNQNVRYHSWDMISGKVNPELGGDPKYLNILGVNYYFYNQQQVSVNKQGSKETFVFKSIPLNSPNRLSLTQILTELSERYQAPIVLAETGSYRDRRPAWWNYVLSEASAAVKAKVPLYGVCAYPTLDIIKGSGFIIPKSGLWDFDQRDKSLKRIPHKATLNVIKKYAKSF